MNWKSVPPDDGREHTEKEQSNNIVSKYSTAPYDDGKELAIHANSPIIPIIKPEPFDDGE